MANNTINHLLRLSVCVLAIAGLAGCGGGGGGGGNSGGDDGGVTVVRPQCVKPAPVNQPLRSYDFWLPGINPSNGEVTLIDANDLASQKAPITALSGSAVVAQGGEFQQGTAGGQPPTVDNLRPVALAYVDKQSGEVYRRDLGSNKIDATPQKLTTGAKIDRICTVSIVAVDFDWDNPEYYYLYSVPAIGSNGTCNISPAQDIAYLVPLYPDSASLADQGSPIDNAQPLATLADVDTGTLQVIIALDKDNNLNVYDGDYANGQSFPRKVSTAGDLYHSLDLEFADVVVKDDGSHEIWRLKAEGPGQVTLTTVDLGADATVTASTADSDFFYYAVQTSSGYAIYRIPLYDTPLSPNEPLYSVAKKGAWVSVLRATSDRLIFQEPTNSRGGRLYAIAKNSPTPANTAQVLNDNVLTNPPFVVAHDHVYYTAISDSAGNTKAYETDDVGNTVGGGPWERSEWLASTLPADRPSGVAVPEYVLLAAGYTDAPPSLKGAILDSLPTDSNSSCVMFSEDGLANPGITFDRKLRYASFGIGYIYDGSGQRQAQFIFDASDGRFEPFPKVD